MLSRLDLLEKFVIIKRQGARILKKTSAPSIKWGRARSAPSTESEWAKVIEANPRCNPVFGS